MFYDCVASTSSVVDVRAIRMRCPSKKFASNNAIVDCFIGVAVATYMYLLSYHGSAPLRALCPSSPRQRASGMV